MFRVQKNISREFEFEKTQWKYSNRWWN